jgi:hypothetical protein
MLRSTRGARPFLEAQRNPWAFCAGVLLCVLIFEQRIGPSGNQREKPGSPGVSDKYTLLTADHFQHTVFNVVITKLADESYP